MKIIFISLCAVAWWSQTVNAQWLTFDSAQAVNASVQIGHEISELAKLDQQIMQAKQNIDLVENAARYFPSDVKATWTATGNAIVGNWTTPNYYGGTSGWSSAVNSGASAGAAWSGATLQMPRGDYIAADTANSARNLAYSSSVNAYDGAGPVALATIGNARAQQLQIDGAIGRLQTAAADGTSGDNSEVQQLNLVTAANIIALRQQQTSATLMTSMLEQQTIANMQRRNEMAYEMNQYQKYQQKLVSTPTAWGNAAQSLQNYQVGGVR